MFVDCIFILTNVSTFFQVSVDEKNQRSQTKQEAGQVQ